MKFNSIKVIKFFSIFATIAGTLGTAWVTDKENKITLEKLVSQRLGK